MDSRWVPPPLPRSGAAAAAAPLPRSGAAAAAAAAIIARAGVAVTTGAAGGGGRSGKDKKKINYLIQNKDHVRFVNLRDVISTVSPPFKSCFEIAVGKCYKGQKLEKDEGTLVMNVLTGLSNRIGRAIGQSTSKEESVELRTYKNRVKVWITSVQSGSRVVDEDDDEGAVKRLPVSPSSASTMIRRREDYDDDDDELPSAGRKRGFEMSAAAAAATVEQDEKRRRLRQLPPEQSDSESDDDDCDYEVVNHDDWMKMFAVAVLLDKVFEDKSLTPTQISAQVDRILVEHGYTRDKLIKARKMLEKVYTIMKTTLVQVVHGGAL